MAFPQGDLGHGTDPEVQHLNPAAYGARNRARERSRTTSVTQHEAPLPPTTDVASPTSASTQQQASGRLRARPGHIHRVESSPNPEGATSSSGGSRIEKPSTRSRGRGWTPFVLRRSCILGFATFFGLMIVSLCLLWYFDRRDRGLATVQTSRHYLWTYGPTLGKSTLRRLVSAYLIDAQYFPCSPRSGIRWITGQSS